MKDFSNLTWVCGHIGFANDSLTIFLNLHHNRSIRYSIVRDRMRSSKPGVLLNWAWYYPRWYRDQYLDKNLHQQLHLDQTHRFAQAHFFMREGDLLFKFPESRTLTILVNDPKLIEYYACYAHFKLLDKRLYASWYEVQKKNYPLNLSKNQEFADVNFEQGMTALQYRSIAFLDWQGEIASTYSDPVAEWHRWPYHTNFMENRNTLMIDHTTWRPMYVAGKQHSIYIDRLVNPATHHLNQKYYTEICELLGLVPNFDLFRSYWNEWLSRQPDVKSYIPQLSWNLTKKNTCATIQT
jgi:hypothetical protein